MDANLQLANIYERSTLLRKAKEYEGDDEMKELENDIKAVKIKIDKYVKLSTSSDIKKTFEGVTNLQSFKRNFPDKDFIVHNKEEIYKYINNQTDEKFNKTSIKNYILGFPGKSSSTGSALTVEEKDNSTILQIKNLVDDMNKYIRKKDTLIDDFKSSHPVREWELESEKIYQTYLTLIFKTPASEIPKVIKEYNSRIVKIEKLTEEEIEKIKEENEKLMENTKIKNDEENKLKNIKVENEENIKTNSEIDKNRSLLIDKKMKDIESRYENIDASANITDTKNKKKKEIEDAIAVIDSDLAKSNPKKEIKDYTEMENNINTYSKNINDAKRTIDTVTINTEAVKRSNAFGRDGKLGMFLGSEPTIIFIAVLVILLTIFFYITVALTFIFAAIFNMAYQRRYIKLMAAKGVEVQLSYFQLFTRVPLGAIYVIIYVANYGFTFVPDIKNV